MVAHTVIKVNVKNVKIIMDGIWIIGINNVIHNVEIL